MPIFRERTDNRTVLAASMDEVWAFNDDLQAQVELDPRFHRLDVIEGVWGESGSRLVATGTLPSGVLHTWETEFVEVNRPQSFTTRQVFPEGAIVATHEYRAVDGGVEWRHVYELTTRQLNAVEYVALWIMRPKRRRDARRAYRDDVNALEAALVAMRER